MSALTGDAGTIAPWLPGGQALAIIGLPLAINGLAFVIFGPLLTIIDHQWLLGGWAMAIILSRQY